MFHIKYMGYYKEESQLINDATLPAGAVQFKEGDNLSSIFILGAMVGMPFILSIIFLAYFKMKEVNYGYTFELNSVTIITYLVACLIMVASLFVHEFIHAILFPLKAEKTIWFYPQQGALFVYCNALVSKIRFVVICLAPAFILGVIPFVFWYVFAKQIQMPYSYAIVVISIANVVASVGDFANVYNAIRQVPKGAKIFNYGFHTFWLK